MVRKAFGSKRYSFGKQLVIFLFLFLSASILYSQESRTWEVSPERIVIGDLDRISATYITSLDWSDDLTIEYPSENGIMYYLSEPRIEPVTEGKYKGKARVVVTFKMLKRGIYQLNPFTIKKNRGGISTPIPPLLISALQSDEKNYSYPLDVQWSEGMPRQLYVGQPLYLVLLLKNTKEIFVPDDIRLAAPETGVLERESYSPPIETVQYGALRLYSVPISVWVYTPTVPGRVIIPAAQVQIGSLRRETASVTLDILPFPVELENTGAIGNFRVFLETDKSELSSGDYLTISVNIEGTGNLHFLKVPAPVIEPSSGMTLLNTTEESRLTPVKTGYSGLRTFKYRYQCMNSGSYRVKLDPFLFFDPDRKSIQKAVVSEKSILVENGLSSNSDSPASLEKKPLSSVFLAFYDLRLDHRNPYLFVLLIPGILLMAFHFLSRWGLKKQTLKALFYLLCLICFLVFISSLGVNLFLKKHPETLSVDKGNREFNDKKFDEALFYYYAAYNISPDNPAILYNLGLTYMEKGDVSASIYYLRKALTQRPWDSRIYGLLMKLERESQLDRDSVPVYRMIPEAVFFGVLIFLDLFFLLVFLYLRSGKIRMALAGLFSLLVACSLLALYVGTSIRINRPFAVIRNIDTDMKKAPSSSASPWLEMEKGTSVTIVADIEEYLLVRTIYDVEGWIRKEDLWF